LTRACTAFSTKGSRYLGATTLAEHFILRLAHLRLKIILYAMIRWEQGFSTDREMAEGDIQLTQVIAQARA
jgi:hypothetical protein